VDPGIFSDSKVAQVLQGLHMIDLNTHSSPLLLPSTCTYLDSTCTKAVQLPRALVGYISTILLETLEHAVLLVLLVLVYIGTTTPAPNLQVDHLEQ
jgi:hypothetical protein